MRVQQSAFSARDSGLTGRSRRLPGAFELFGRIADDALELPFVCMIHERVRVDEAGVVEVEVTDRASVVELDAPTVFASVADAGDRETDLFGSDDDVGLTEAGKVSRQEWADRLGTVLKEAEARGEYDTGRHYYDHWLTALERLVVEKNMTDWHELEHEGEAIREDDHHRREEQLAGR